MNSLTVRVLPVMMVFACAFWAFSTGVDFTERPGAATADLATRVYYVSGLFVLGGMDLGVPMGGTEVSRFAMWVAYFLAPAITTTAVAEGLIRMLQPKWLIQQRMRDHIVIVGVGRFGMLCLSALREATDAHVVVVDKSENLNAQEAQSRLGAQFLRGDITRRATRRLLNLDRARGVVLMTDNDLVNLEVAWNILDNHPGAKVAVHVSDIAMRRSVGQLLAHREGPAPIVFNAHRVAASHLYSGHLEAFFEATAGRDIVVIAGFGRFGQTILEYLQREAGVEIGTVIVVDKEAGVRKQQFAEQVGFRTELDVHVRESDLADPRTWPNVMDMLEGTGPPPVYVLCADSDNINLRAAMAIRRRDKEARIHVRIFHASHFTLELAREYDFQVLAVESLLLEALRDHQAEWFGIAAKS